MKSTRRLLLSGAFVLVFSPCFLLADYRRGTVQYIGTFSTPNFQTDNDCRGYEIDLFRTSVYQTDEIVLHETVGQVIHASGWCSNAPLGPLTFINGSVEGPLSFNSYLSMSGSGSAQAAEQVFQFKGEVKKDSLDGSIYLQNAAKGTPPETSNVSLTKQINSKFPAWSYIDDWRSAQQSFFSTKDWPQPTDLPIEVSIDLLHQINFQSVNDLPFPTDQEQKILEKFPDSAAAGEIHWRRGVQYWKRNDAASARSHMTVAYDIIKKQFPDSWGMPSNWIRIIRGAESQKEMVIWLSMSAEYILGDLDRNEHRDTAADHFRECRRLLGQVKPSWQGLLMNHFQIDMVEGLLPGITGGGSDPFNFDELLTKAGY